MIRCAFVLTLALLFAPPVMGRDNILQTAAEAGNFTKLVNLLVVTGLDQALEEDGHFTVFAPSDEAFAALPPVVLETLLKNENREQLAGILKYHVIPQALLVPKKAPPHPLTETATLQGSDVQFQRDGSHVRVNDVNIVVRNIKCSNGYIHVIDAVLMPPDDDGRNTILDVAEQAGTFETLLAAIEVASLNEALTGTDDLTVFAPTDAAFAEIPKKTLARLLKPENREQLQTLLKYHVTAGRFSAADLASVGTATTLANSSVSVRIENGRLQINSASVVVNDIEADNGLIHVIDQVLTLPE